jgi:hypothetical protein
MPAVSETNKPEDFLGVIKNEEGNVIQLVVKNATLMSNQDLDGMDIKIGNRYQMNSLARYYNVDLNALQDLTPVAETEEAANANDIDSIGDSAVSPEAKEAVVTAKTILQQGPTANLYKAFMAGDSSKAKFKQTVSNLTAGELDSVAQTASAFYDWATSNENIPPEVRPRLIQGAEDLKSRVALAAQIHIDNAAKLEGIKWDTISDEEKAAYNEELGEEQDKLEAELNAAAAARTTTLSDKDKAATQAALDAAQRKLSKGVSEPQQATTKKGEAEGNEVIEGDDPQKILSNLIQRLRAVNDEVPIIVESAEGFISPAAANRQIKQLKAAIQQATESEDTEQLKLLSDRLSKVTTRVYTMKEAEQIKTKLKFFVNELYKDPEYIAEASERLGRLESAMSVGKRILSSRKSSFRKQIAELIPEDTDATDLTDDETQLADMLSRIEGTRPPKPEVLPKPKRIKHEPVVGEDWSTEDKLHLFRSEAEERAFNSLVDDGIIISDLSKYGATISAREQELLGFEGPQLFTKKRYLGDPTNPNKYIKGKHILLARKVLERFPLVEPPADASTTKSKNNFTDPVAGKRGKVDLPVYRDKAQFISEGVFTNDPRTSREFIDMGIPVVIPPDLIKKHKNPKDPFFINKSIDFDEDSGVVLSVLDPITREPKMFSGEQTMVSNEGYLPYRTNRIMSLISGVMEPSPQYLKLLGNTVSGRQPVYGRGLPAREYLVDFRRLLFEGEAIDPEVAQLGGIETSAGYRYLRDTYGLSDESIASASTAAISEYTLGIYEYAMGQALRSYVSKAMLFAKNKGMDAVVKQALKDARAEYGDTLSKAELEQIPDSYFLKYVEPDKRALKDLDPIRVISQFFYSNNKDAIAESIVSMYPEFGSSSSGAVISKYAESLFDRVSNPKGNLFTGPKQPFSILDHYGDLYQRAEIRRRKYKSFGGIGEENASILDRLVTSGEAKSSTAAKGMDDLTTDPLFVKGYDEVTGDPEATYAYRDSLRTTLIKTVNSEPQLQAAFQDIAGSFNETLATLEGEQLLDVLANVISNAGDRNVSLAVTNRLYSLRNIAGLRAAGIMAELGWLPPVVGFKAVAPEVRATTELESPEASRERLLQIISAAKDSSYRAANMATPEEEATYRARLVEAVQMAQPEIQQAISVANEKSIQAELRDKYRESMSRVLYKLEDGEESYASAVSGLRNDITKGQDRLVKLEELIAESDANISDVKLGVGKISKDQEALRPKFNELSNYLQSLIEKKSEGDNTVDPRLEKATAAFEKVNQQMDKYNGIISRYASNLKLFERERNKFVNEQGALTKYLDRTTPVAIRLEGMTYAEAVKQIKASRRSADLDSGTLTKVSESMKLKAQRIVAEKVETIPADEKPYQKVVREAAAAAAQLRYNSERGNLYKASNIATNAQLEAAARTANTRDIERYGLFSNDRESMLGAIRAMTKSSVESHREVANLLLLAPDFIRSVRFGIVDVRSDWSGLYDAQTNTVLLNVAGHNGRGLADVILHEYLHAATVTYFKNPRTAEQRAAVKRIGQIRQLAVAQATKKGLMKFAHVRDGLANDAEFLTYTLTAPEFQASLSLLTPPNQSSILSRVIDAILSFFGKKNFKLQEAVRELLDFTQMGLVNFHTYNVSTKRDTNALIEKGQYIRNEMEDTMFLQGLLDDIMSGNVTQDDTVFGDMPDRIFFSVSDVEKLNTPSGISLQSFAAAFTSRIKPETKTYDQLRSISTDIIEDHIKNPEKYIVKATNDGISRMYRRLLTMPDGKEYDPDNIEHADASDQTIQIYNLIQDGGFDQAIEQTVSRINDDRAEAIKNFAEYLREESEPYGDPEPTYGLYDEPEAALLLVAASKYAVRTEADVKSDNGLRYRVIEMTSDNEQMPFVADAKTASEVISHLRDGKKIKDAIKLAYTKQQTSSAEASKKFGTGWYVFKKSDKHEDAVELNAAVAGTSWCTGGSVNTAKNHLSGGDFHVFFENGKPEVAIRTSNGQLAEPPRGNTPNQSRTQKHEEILRDYLLRSDTGLTGAEDFIADREFLDRVVRDKGFSSFTNVELLNAPRYRRSSNGYGSDSLFWPESVYSSLERETRKRKDIYYVEGETREQTDASLQQAPPDIEYIAGNFRSSTVKIEEFPKLKATNLHVLVTGSNYEYASNLVYAKGVYASNLSIGGAEVSFPSLESADDLSVLGDGVNTVFSFPKLKTANKLVIESSNAELPALTKARTIHVQKGGSAVLPELTEVETIRLGRTDSGFMNETDAARSIEVPKLINGGTILGRVDNFYGPSLETLQTLDITGYISLPRLTKINFALELHNDSAYDLPNLTSVYELNSASKTAIKLPSLTTIEGSVSSVRGPLDLPELTTIRWNLENIYHSINVPKLTSIGGNIENVSVDLTLPALTAVDGAIGVSRGTTLNLPALTTVNNDIFVEASYARLAPNAPKVAAVIAPELTFVKNYYLDPSIDLYAPRLNREVITETRGDLADEDIINYIRVPERQGDTAIDVLGEIRRITPAGINIEIDDTMVGAMGARRSKPNTIIVNSKLINDIGAGLSVANAKAAVRTAVDEELAHLASYTVFTEQDFVNLANDMGPAMLDKVAHFLYATAVRDHNERAARIAADRESGILSDADIAVEFIRMEMTNMAVGRTREEHIAFLYTNPSLLDRWLEALKAFISRLKQRFSEEPTTGTAARISQASRALRKLREGGVLPEPEESAANELGDSVAFFNALNGDIIEGQEDRTRYMLPIAASGNRNQVDAFWKKIEDKYYNFPLELRKLLALREGTLSEVEYTMENFSRVFPKLRDAALARGAAIEDIGKVLGTTAPAIQRQARKQIKDKVKQFKIANAKDPDLERKATEYESQITSIEADKFFTQFRQEQKIVENNLRASGFGELVDFLVEFRQEINKYKAVVNFDESNDVYLTRSFKFFSSEGWALAAKAGGKITIDGKEVDFDKLRAAALTHFEWEVDEAAKKKKEVLTKDQRDQRLVQALDNYLRKLELEAEQSKELGPMQSLRKDLNRMLTKQDFDSPLRKLLGEVEDPFENAVRTIYSVGRMAANERFLENFADQAIAIGVASRDRKPNMELLFPPSQSAELGDLAGLYVDSKVAAAFREELGINMRSQDSRSAGMINNIGRWLSKFSGLTITAKTLGSIGFYPRNILGGIALTTAQGIVNPTDFARSARLAIAASLPISKTQADSKEMRNELRRLTELQIIRDDTRGRIAMDMLKGFVASTDEQLEELMTEIIEAQATGNVDKVSKRFGGLQKAGISTVEFLAGLNNVIDSAFKLNAYFYELSVLKDAYGNSETESTLEAMAAQKVKRTFPTHSDQISLAKSFGRSPFSMLVLPFVRWKSEVFRTMINTIPLAVQEIKSGNDVLARRGAKRLAGFTATMLFGGSVYGGLFATLFGLLTDDEDDERAALRKLSEEEMEALRLALPEWQRNHGVFAQKLRDGGIQVIDLTNILPYSQLTDIVGLATRGDVKGIADYLTSELIGTQIAASTAIEISQNRDEYDQPIWLPTDDGFSATVKMLMHLGKGTVLPSVVDKAIKVGRYGEQNAKEMIVGEFTGVRPIIHKAADIEYRGMRNLKDSADAVVSLLYPLSGGRALDVDDVGDVIDEHQSASNENQRKLHNFIKGMKSMGSTEASLANTAQQMKFSKQRFGAALDGVNIPWVPNKQWFQKMYDNKIRTGEQNPDEIAAKINEILSRKPDFYNVNVD